MTMQRVETSTLTGLSLLLDAGLLDSPKKSTELDETNVVEAFKDNHRIGFVDDNGVTVVNLIDLGGKRLHRGLSCPQAFTYFPALRILNLAGTDLPNDNLVGVLTTVAPSIESVFLGGNGLGNAGASVVASWLAAEHPPKLVKMDLRYNDIGGAGCTALCKAMQESGSTLQYLHLEGNMVGDDGCYALSHLLRHESCRLVELFAGANGIGPLEATHLAPALIYSATLTKLYLEGNSIGDGAISFCEALEGLKENKKVLQHLFVDNNNMGKELALRLARALNSATAMPDSMI